MNTLQSITANTANEFKRRISIPFEHNQSNYMSHVKRIRLVNNVLIAYIDCLSFNGYMSTDQNKFNEKENMKPWQPFSIEYLIFKLLQSYFIVADRVSFLVTRSECDNICLNHNQMLRPQTTTSLIFHHYLPLTVYFSDRLSKSEGDKMQLSIELYISKNK